jgi:hypothetical protein
MQPGQMIGAPPSDGLHRVDGKGFNGRCALIIAQSHLWLARKKRRRRPLPDASFATIANNVTGEVVEAWVAWMTATGTGCGKGKGKKREKGQGQGSRRPLAQTKQHTTAPHNQQPCSPCSQADSHPNLMWRQHGDLVISGLVWVELPRTLSVRFQCQAPLAARPSE